MKKTKLLSSLSALLLVISLGACSENDEAKDLIVLNNYTINLSLTENGTNISLPSYDSMYLIGDWDDWSEFILLSESNGKFSTTFEQISTGTHEFKCLTGLREDEPSLTMAETLSATFEVLGEDGDNYINNLTFEITGKVYTLEETPMTDEEIASILLGAISDAYYSGLDWSAFHGGITDNENGTRSVSYLSTDTRGRLYGVIRGYDSKSNSLLSEYYYQDGTAYFHRLSDDYRSSESISGTYASLLSDYAKGLKPFINLSVSDLGNTLTLANDGGAYILTAAGSDVGMIIFERTGDVFTISEIQNTSTTLFTFCEPSTKTVVDAQIGDFSSLYWGTSSPAEFIELAYLAGNYSAIVEYDTYVGANTMTYAEYQNRTTDEEAAEKYEALFDDVGLESSYLIYLYYDTDYFLAISYEYMDGDDGYGYYNIEIEILVNDHGTCWDYWTLDGENWSYYAYYGYSWQSFIYSLSDVYQANLQIIFDYYGSGTLNDIPYYSYEINWFYEMFGYSAQYLLCLGFDYLFGSYASYYCYYFEHYLTYFFYEEQAMMSCFYSGGITYDDDELTDDTLIYYLDQEFYSTMYDIGTTDESDIVYYYHELFQSQM